MQNVNRCISCGSNKLSAYPCFVSSFFADQVWHREPFEVLLFRCGSCGFVFYRTRLDEEEISEFYKDYRGEKYQIKRQRYDPWYSKEINESIGKDQAAVKNRKKNLSDMIKRDLSGHKFNSILDWGGDYGQFIPDEFQNADRYVYEISGISPLEGIKLFTSVDQFKQRTFDLIMCCHVMEHASYPLSLLKQIMEASHESTVFYFEVPDESPFKHSFARGAKSLFVSFLLMSPFVYRAFYSAYKKVFGRAPRFFQMTEHLNFFSVGSLRKMLANSGLEIIEIKSINVDHGWMVVPTISCLARRKSPA